MVVKMFDLYFVCFACDVRMNFQIKLGRPVYIRNMLVKLTIALNATPWTYIHTYVGTDIHEIANTPHKSSLRC